MTHLQSLVDKYTKRLAELESQIIQVRQKLDAVSIVQDLLEEEGLSDKQSSLFAPSIKQESDKYAKANYTEAISDILFNTPGLTGADIYGELLKHGFRSSSKTQRRDVFVKLYRLEKAKKVISTKDGGAAKRYRLVGKVPSVTQQQNLS